MVQKKVLALFLVVIAGVAPAAVVDMSLPLGSGSSGLMDALAGLMRSLGL